MSTIALKVLELVKSLPPADQQIICAGLARDMDRDTGVNHTYIFADFTESHINDFNSPTSWDLSADRRTITGGLLFVF